MLEGLDAPQHLGLAWGPKCNVQSCKCMWDPEGELLEASSFCKKFHFPQVSPLPFPTTSASRRSHRLPELERR